MVSRVEILVFLNNEITKVGTYSMSGLVGPAYNDGGQTNLNMGRFANNSNGPTIPDTYILQPSPVTTEVDPNTSLPKSNSVFVPRGGLKAYTYLTRQSYYLDLYPNDTQIPITYQVSDLVDISSVNSTYTKTITIPESHNNMQAFGFISDLSSNSTFNPNKKARAYVLVDSIVVMEGYIQLTNVVKNTNTGVTNLQCVIFADNDNLWKNIAERELTDLDFREMDHARTVQALTQSWTKGPDELGYYYPLIDYGSSGNQSYGLSQLAPAYGDWTLSDIGGVVAFTGGIGNVQANQPWVNTSLMYPAIYVKTIIDKIFTQAGYQYKSNFLNSSYFKTLMIPFSRTVLKRSPSFEWDKTFRVGMGYIPGGTYSPQHGTWSMVMATTIAPTGVIRNIGKVPGIGNITSTGALDYNYDNVRVRFTDNGFNFNDGYNYPWNIQDNDPGRNWSTQSFVYNNALTATSSGGYKGRTKQRFGVYYKIIENIIPTAGQFYTRPSYLTVRRSRDRTGVTFSSWSNTTYGGTNNLASNPGVFTTFNPEGALPINGNRQIQVPTGNPGYFYTEGTIKLDNPATISYWTYSTSRVEQRTYEGTFYTDWLNNDDTTNANNFVYPIKRGEQFYLEYNAAWGRTFAGFTASQICPETVIWNEFYPDADGTAPAVEDVEPIDMNQVLPLKVKQKDFLMSIIKMFNLIVEPNKSEFYPNILTIEPRDDFYNSGLTKDWSSKLDRNADLNVQILAETQNKTTILKFKDDSDFYNQKYVEKWKEQYGQYKYITDNDFVEGEKKVEVIFSPTPIVAVINSKGFIIPKISKLSGNQFNRSESNIRIVRKAPTGVVQNPYGEYWGLGLSASHLSPVAPGSYYTFSYYPYVGHFDNPYTPTDDLNFGQTTEIFYNATSTVTNQNLFNKYWYKQMNEYTGKNSRVITGMFYLKPQDIYDFRFSDKIYIDNQYYKVLKISDYDAANPFATTKVQLIKTDSITVPKAKSRGIVAYPNNGGSITALGSERNLILSSGSGAIGSNNTINDASFGTLVAGSNNRLEGSNNSTIVSGNNNSIGFAVDQSNVFGSSNSVSENSIATIFGHRNITGPSASANFFGNNNIVDTNINAHVVGDNNTLNSSHEITQEVSTVFGYNNIIGTNSTSTHILGSNNIVAESGTASNISHILGNNNYVIPTSATTNDLSIIHVVGSDNLIHPTITPLNTVFGSRNILGTNSIGYIVGSDNIIAAAVTQSIVIGSNNIVDASSATVFGDNNSVPDTTYNSKIFGNNITFASSVSNSTAIGRNINATESDKVYLSDVIISGGGTGSAFSLSNTLAVGNDPENQTISGTVSIVRGSYSLSALQVAPLFTKLDSGGGYEETYIQRSGYTGGLTFSVRTGEYYSGTVKSVNLIELDVEAMISSGAGSGEMYYTKITRVMNNSAILIGLEDQVIKSTLTSGRDITITFIKTGIYFDIVIYIAGSSSDYDFLIKAKRTTLGPAI